MIPACFATRDDIISSIFLVGGDEIGIVDTREWFHESHFLVDHSFQSGFEDLSTIHGSSNVQAADIPTTNDQIVRMNHGQDIVKGDVDLVPGLFLCTKLDG